jgi:dihydrofolate reductase
VDEERPPATLSVVVAMDRNGVIGRAGRLPWRLSSDLKRFKAITMGKPLVMGRRTHESIGRPLPGRRNIVITRNRDYRAPGCTVVHSLAEALEAAGEAPEIMVVGGAALYREALPLAGRMYLTEVQDAGVGDVHFPPFRRGEWRIVHEEDVPADDRNQFPSRFLILERAVPAATLRSAEAGAKAR